MTPNRPNIDEILVEFFGREREGKRGLTLQRIDLAERMLRGFLEAEGNRILVDDDLVLLAAEREFEPDGAFVRTMHADDLIFALPIFLNSADSLEPLDRRVQLRMADRLVGTILRKRLVNQDELLCPLLEARVAIDSGRAQLRHPALRDG
jgi:hypothetical protein